MAEVPGRGRRIPSQLDTATAIAWIRRAADDVTAQADRLTQLDTVIGDGDHGANLSRGLAAAVVALDDNPPGTPGRVLITAGRAIVSKTGGASGPLYGTAFRRAGKALGDTAEAHSDTLADALAAMLEGIQELGGAVEGDKTMVDALAPAVAAFGKAADDGATLAEAAAAAAEASDGGRLATIPLRARKGRASYLGERSVGHEDPGAASTAMILHALVEVLESS